MRSDIPRVPVQRVLSYEEAGALVGTQAPALDPTFRDEVLYVDADTGAPVLANLAMPDRGAFRRNILQVKMGGSSPTPRASGVRNTSRTFGNRPRKPMMGQEACMLARLADEQPDVHAYLVSYSETMGAALGEAFPEIELADRETIEKVLPEWRLSDESLWTSGVINSESALPYHRDGNNFEAWSAMPVMRRGVAGGHLHIPEYDMVVPCRDGYAVMFYGKGLVHGVTPMRVVVPGGYRISVVYYALQGLKDCHTYAAETALARRKRTEREERMAAPGYKPERLMQGKRTGQPRINAAIRNENSGSAE